MSAVINTVIGRMAWPERPTIEVETYVAMKAVVTYAPETEQEGEQITKVTVGGIDVTAQFLADKDYDDSKLYQKLADALEESKEGIF